MRHEAPRLPTRLPLSAVARANPAKPADDPVGNKWTALEKQADEALMRERGRSKADLCAHAGDGSDPAVGNCWQRESRTTDGKHCKNLIHDDILRYCNVLLKM
jgi:hypothetical protein